MQRQAKIIVSLISIAFLASSLSRVEAQAERRSRFFIANRVSNLCLGVLGVDGHGPGVRLEVYHCNPGGGDAGNDNQWTIKGLGKGYSQIVNRVSGMCLGVVGVDDHWAGAAVEVYRCNPGSGDAGEDNQWTIRRIRP